MYKIESKIDVKSKEFLKNKEEFLTLLNNYKDILRNVTKGGSEDAVKKHKERHKLLARERIYKLIDTNTPFLELSSLAAFGQYNDEFPSAGIVTGIGLVQGRETVLIANDATVKGGTYMKWTIKKHS